MQITGNGLHLSPENLQKTEGGSVEKILAALKSGDSKSVSLALMEPGTYFHGKVLEIFGNKATIGMENGQQFLAKIESNISMELNQNLLFEVKSNDKGTIAVRPIPMESAMDVTATKALTASNISVTPKNVEIVKNLLDEKLPVDKQNIQKMLRYTVENPATPIKTLVQMVKANIPVTPENIEQFIKYQESSHPLVTEMEQFLDTFLLEMEDLANQGQTKEVLQLNQKVLDLVLSQLGNTTVLQPEQLQQLEGLEKLFVQLEQMLQGEGAIEKQNTLLKDGTLQQTGVAGENGEIANILGQKQLGITEDLTHGENQAEAIKTEINQSEQVNTLIGKVLGELAEATKPLSDIIKDLVKEPEYQDLLKRSLNDQILLLPEDVADKEKVQETYSRIQREMQVLRDVMENVPRQEMAAAKQAKSIEGNLDFMQQLNQVYSYIQLPLKMAGENAHGDLYVFADRKGLKQEKEELSALLHLDMENLGALDIFVTLKGKNVGTKITLENEEILDLFAEHMNELTERLEKKGYQVETTLETGEVKPDFVQDFLLKGESAGDVRRFSFDVKA